ncbi:MAG: hypothetical protein CVV25_02735 [Ignavibacteriae bacterium HGW-Ignavibacteriae-4]|jgi:ELWxxDGT repeat protein|nr:MAG: hypothetical protein CVV25_02735 [Ignavibacteriae bacterium HGW-Ignavibacteriae-4]
MKTILLLIIAILLSSNILAIEPELYSEQKFVDDIRFWQFIEHNNMGYLIGDDGENGKELWTFNGKNGHLEMLKDINPNGDSNPIIISSNIKGKLIFSALDTLGLGIWSTNGTKEETILLMRIRKGQFETFESSIVHNNKAFFEIQYDNDIVGIGYSDGTVEGTGMISDSIGSKSNLETTLYEFNNKLVIVMRDRLYYREILALDDERQVFISLTNETRELYKNKDREVAVVGDKLLFTRVIKDNGYKELWITDGTTKGTERLLNDKVFSYLRVTPPKYSSLFKGKLYFTTSNVDNSGALWVSDGTREGTKQFKLNDTTLWAGFLPNDQSKYEKLILISKDSIGDYNLMRTDGTEYGTNFYDLNLLTYSNYSFLDYRFALTKDRIFYMSNIPKKKRVLWMQYYYDDVKQLVVDYSEHDIAESSAVLDTTTINERCLYNVRLDPKMYSLFTTDGVDNEPTFVLEDSVSFSGGLYYSKLIDNMMYFIMTDHSSMQKLCRTDMKRRGTDIIQMDDAPLTRQVGNNSGVIEVNGYVYFLANYYNIHDHYNLYRIKSPIMSNVEREVFKSSEVAVYPNPVSDKVFIEIVKPTTITLVDMNGKSIRVIELDTPSEIDISELSEGVYFILDETGKAISKFVKE